MKVELISHTNNALELLLYTKNTRLQGGETLQDICEWPEEKKLDHFKYMLDTIQSSFEFVDYVFKISGVPRSFTHQLVRTRTGSYAQESQRTVDVRNHEADIPAEAKDIIEVVTDLYGRFIDEGMQVQEAREMLPIGIHTSIIAKFNLRTIHDMALVRLCTRTAGVYQKVFREMKRLICEIHPWAEDFIQVSCAWNGVCAFPRYTECPIHKFSLNNSAKEEMNKAKIRCRNALEDINYVANPIAKGGMTQ